MPEWSISGPLSFVNWGRIYRVLYLGLAEAPDVGDKVGDLFVFQGVTPRVHILAQMEGRPALFGHGKQVLVADRLHARAVGEVLR